MCYRSVERVFILLRDRVTLSEFLSLYKILLKLLFHFHMINILSNQMLLTFNNVCNKVL